MHSTEQNFIYWNRRQCYPILIQQASLRKKTHTHRNQNIRVSHSSYLSTHQLQQRWVHGKKLNVCVDSGLVKWASFAVEFIQAHLADSMATTQADGLSNCFVKSLSANWAGKKIRPLWSLYRHCFWSYYSLTHTHTISKAKIPLESKSLKKVYLFFFFFFKYLL